MTLITKPIIKSLLEDFKLCFILIESMFSLKIPGQLSPELSSFPYKKLIAL